jgi:hypothetical protein
MNAPLWQGGMSLAQVMSLHDTWAYMGSDGEWHVPAWLSSLTNKVVTHREWLLRGGNRRSAVIPNALPVACELGHCPCTRGDYAHCLLDSRARRIAGGA